MSNPNASSASGQATVGQVQGRNFNRGARPQKIKFGIQELDLTRGINHITFGIWKRPATVFIYSNSPRILPIVGKRVNEAIEKYLPEQYNSRYYSEEDTFITLYNYPKITAEVDNGDKFCVISVCLIKSKYLTINTNHWFSPDPITIEGLCQEILNEIDIETKAL